ncbi:helix-turn-helix domain-containing protein [Thalassotalea euphylliae]|uniref:AraC family transcriptional regulator n=1 Tax=Thalassotalea euphylliae TaxID=1655234 RepID=UPI003633D842
MKALLAENIQRFSCTQVPLEDYDRAFAEFDLANIADNGGATLDVNWLYHQGIAVVERFSDSIVSQHGKSVESAFSFVLPSPNRHSFNAFYQHNDDDYQSFLVTPGDYAHWQFAGGTPSLTLAIDADMAQHLLSESELMILLERGRSIRRNAIEQSALQETSQRFTQLINQPFQQPANTALLSNQITQAASELLNMVCEQMTSNVKIDSRSRVLARAVEYIKAYYHQPFMIGDVANHAHTTVRNLQYIFKAQLNLTPLQFLKQYRLYKFHCFLPRHRTVESAAHAAGFKHMGRASAAYKHWFGFSPSKRQADNTDAKFFSWLSRSESRLFIT